jgi:hypothetical protein
VKKNVSQGDFAALQLCLPGTHDLHFVVDAMKRICDCSRSQSGVSPLRCSEAPWQCPKGVPPACNTGVHSPGARQRLEASSEGNDG